MYHINIILIFHYCIDMIIYNNSGPMIVLINLFTTARWVKIPHLANYFIFISLIQYSSSTKDFYSD